MLELSVVIPAKNEQDNIQPLVSEIRQALDGRYQYEIIYINDGSTDHTLERLREIRASGFQRLRIISHQHSCGQSTAVMTGVRQAQGEWIVTLDADGQNDPADIPAMVEQLRNAHAQDARYTLAAGYRKNRQDTNVKRWSSKIANKVRRWLLNDGTPDTGCGLKVIQREQFLRLPYFHHMHRYLPALVQRDGNKISIVEVNHRPRHSGTSNYGIHNRLWVGIVDLFGVRWLQKRARVPHWEEQ